MRHQQRRTYRLPAPSVNTPCECADLDLSALWLVGRQGLPCPLRQRDVVGLVGVGVAVELIHGEGRRHSGDCESNSQRPGTKGEPGSMRRGGNVGGGCRGNRGGNGNDERVARVHRAAESQLYGSRGRKSGVVSRRRPSREDPRRRGTRPTSTRQRDRRRAACSMAGLVRIAVIYNEPGREPAWRPARSLWPIVELSGPNAFKATNFGRAARYRQAFGRPMVV